MKPTAFCSGVRLWLAGMALASFVFGNLAIGQTPKQAAAKKAAAKVAAIKAAARKIAAQRIAQRKNALNKFAAVIVSKDFAKVKVFTDKAIADKIARDEAAAEKAQSDKVAAERTLAEKEAAVKTATADLATAETAAKKSSNSKTLIRKVSVAKSGVASAERERTNAANTLRSRDFTLRNAIRQVDAGKNVLRRISSAGKRKSAKRSPQKRRQAIRNFTTTAITQAVDNNKVAHEKAFADTAIAMQNLTQKSAAARLAASSVAFARAVADKASAAKIAAEKVVAQKKGAAKVLDRLVVAHQKAASAFASANATAEKTAAAEKVARDDLHGKNILVKTTLAKYYETLALIEGGLKPLPADQWDYAKARHLLCRAGFGGTPEEVEKLHAMGLHAAVEFLVNYDERPTLDLPFHAVLPERTDRSERRLEFTRRRELIVRRRRADAQQQNRLKDWWLQRMVQSPRPLQEKLVLFWHGHFATEYRTVRDSYALAQQNDLLREHAAGNFGALLRGMVRDPAMLRYLDNNSNVKGRPNENLAREIMELFSLGEGNYSEEDIMEGARALTGYTYDANTRQFRFIVSRHDTKNKTIFGRTGNFAGDDFVDLILQQQFASQFIARKQFVFFAHENPSDEVVSRLASLLKRHQYDMRPMLKNLFMSEEFYNNETMASQIKSPIQLVVGTLRDLGIKDVSFRTLGSAVASMGQELYGPPNVKGWEGGRFWVNANRMFVRYNGVADLIERVSVPNQPRGLDIVGALEGKKLDTPDQVVEFLVKSCFVRSISEEKKKILAEQIASLPPSSQWESQRRRVNARLRMLLVLMMSMPEYQCT